MVKSLDADITIITMRSPRRSEDIAFVAKFEIEIVGLIDSDIHSANVPHVLRPYTSV